MNYVQRLQQTESAVCMGMDPDVDRIPIQGQVENVLVKFYKDIIDGVVAESSIAAVKPNYAFYAQYGFPGLRALKEIIDYCREKKIVVVFDGKRADIGKTSMALAQEVFNFWNADAVTVAPYMGKDSVQPFIDYCEKGKGVYLLVRTSNQGAKDFQDLTVGNVPLYRKVAEKLCEWHTPGLGAVVGATYPAELIQLHEYFLEMKKEVPLLIPGVGAQGGSIQDVKKVLNEQYHLVNSSSKINYAFESAGTDDFVGAAVNEVKRLNREIGI